MRKSSGVTDILWEQTSKGTRRALTKILLLLCIIAKGFMVKMARLTTNLKWELTVLIRPLL